MHISEMQNISESAIDALVGDAPRHRLPFYLLHTDPERHHDGLRTNTAPYVFTLAPQPGDRIYARGEAALFVLADGSRVVGFYNELTDEAGRRVRVASHPGRDASLGEDGFEDASRGDCLALYLQEQLSGAEWSVAPAVALPLEGRPAAETLGLWPDGTIRFYAH